MSSIPHIVTSSVSAKNCETVILPTQVIARDVDILSTDPMRAWMLSALHNFSSSKLDNNSEKIKMSCKVRGVGALETMLETVLLLHPLTTIHSLSREEPLT